jgi:hypothetical protein
VSALLERQSHWFKVALPGKTAVPLVFDLARRRDLLRRADTLLDSNSVSKVTSRQRLTPRFIICLFKDLLKTLK